MSSLIGNAPREKLKELMDKHGDVLLQDRDRCEGLLKDYCGAYRKEISALVGALDERIPLELKSSWQTAMTPEAMRARLVQRLEENRGLAPDVAMWAVDAWSHALGVGLGRSSARVEEAAVDMAGGNGAASVAERVARGRQDETAGSTASTLTTKKKAGISAAAALVVAVAVFAMFHHPTPPVSTLNNGGGGTTANGGSGDGVNSGGNSGGAASEKTATGVPSGGSVAGGGTKPEAGKTANGTGRGAGAGGGTGGVSGGAKSGGGNAGAGDASAAAAANAQTLPVGTSFAVRLDKALNSNELNEGDLVAATVATPVTVDGNVLVPAGAVAHLRVSGLTREDKVQALKLALADVSSPQGNTATTSELHSFEGPPLKSDQQKRGGIGGVMSKLFHRGGADAVTGAATAKPEPVKLPAETVMHFSLTAPAKVLK